MDESISVKVVFRPTPKNKNVGNLHIRTINNRKPKYKSLGIQLKNNHWDEKRQMVLPSLKKDYKKYNEKIAKSVEALKFNYNNIQALKVNNTNIIDYWTEHNISTINAGTKQLRQASLNKFVGFLESYNWEQLRLHELTPELIERYESYLHQSLKPRSINTYLGYLKAVVKKAVRHQIVRYRVDPFVNHKSLTNKNKTARSLSMNQVKQLMDISLVPKLDYYRNMFCLQILGGGLRVKDLITLRWKNIYNNEYGTYLTITQTKTGKEVKCKLSSTALFYLNPIFTELEPNRMKGVNISINLLESQNDLMKKLEQKNKYEEYGEENYISGIEHYDMDSKKFHILDKIKKQDFDRLTVNQNIKMYTEDLNLEYGEVINAIKKKDSNQFIFNALMKDIKLSTNNVDLKVDYLVKARIKKYNDHLKELAEKLNIPAFTSHQARHTFSQLLVDSNTNLYFIKQLLGHSNLATTQNYIASLHTSQLDEVSESLANNFR